MKNNILATENFTCGNKHYFLDFKTASNKSNYISIIRSDAQPDGTYERHRVTVFEEDFPSLIGCMSPLFRTAAYLNEENTTIYDLHRQNRELANKGIKSWAPELRPREKMLEHGTEALADAELLALLIGSGTPNETAVDLAGRILDSVGGDLSKLSKLALPDFCKFSGMGTAKASSIMAAMELAERLFATRYTVPIRKMKLG